MTPLPREGAHESARSSIHVSLSLLKAIPYRETADCTGRVQITDSRNVVVGHNPTERMLTLHVARKLSVVPVPVVIQVETVPV